jgi:hypothetical protein
MERFENWSEAYRQMKKLIEDFERMGDRLERRINEVAEMQRPQYLGDAQCNGELQPHDIKSFLRGLLILRLLTEYSQAWQKKRLHQPVP